MTIEIRTARIKITIRLINNNENKQNIKTFVWLTNKKKLIIHIHTHHLTN